jgi:NAD(P)-dependent dehydrogenase (short-subunit alcohol dehydrogenase family)
MDPSAYQARPDLLEGRVILVTGAGRGIGRVAALAFARHGATVILHGRDIPRLEAAYDEIESAGGPQATILPLDLATARDRDFENMALAIESQLGRLDGILHNASHISYLSALEDQRLEEWLLLLRVNLAAPFALTRACTYLLRTAPDASVVFTSETHALEPAAYWGGFAVSKSGLSALAMIQAQEWERFPNLRVNVIVPGVVDSPQRQLTHPGEAPGSRAQADALMPAYLYLMGADSRGVTGQTLLAQRNRATPP